MNTSLPNDTLREILLDSDIDTIKQYYKTHKEAKQLIDKSFWQKKFKQHNFYFPIRTDMSYVDLFEFMEERMVDAKIILKINEMEKNRIYNKTDGNIIVNIEDMDANNLDNLLSSKFERDGYYMNYNTIIFELMAKGYLVKLQKIREKPIIVGYRDIKEIEKLLAYSLTITGLCWDSKEILFLSMDDEAFEEDIEEFYRDVNRVIIASVRRGLWEGILKK